MSPGSNRDARQNGRDNSSPYLAKEGFKMADGLKRAVITTDNKIRCPICGKVNGQISGSEFIYNYKVRCRGSRRGCEHYFLLFAGNKENIKRLTEVM